MPPSLFVIIPIRVSGFAQAPNSFRPSSINCCNSFRKQLSPLPACRLSEVCQTDVCAGRIVKPRADIIGSVARLASVARSDAVLRNPVACFGATRRSIKIVQTPATLVGNCEFASESPDAKAARH